MSSVKVPEIKTNNLSSMDGMGVPYVDNLPAFSSYRTYTTDGSITLNATGNSVLGQYDAVHHNWNNMLVPATGIATIPVTGLYMLTGHASMTHSSLSHCDFSFWKNGAVSEPTWVIDRPSSWAVAETWFSGGLSIMLALNAGDTVSTGVSFANVNTQTLTNVALRYSFTGHLVKRI